MWGGRSAPRIRVYGNPYLLLTLWSFFLIIASFPLGTDCQHCLQPRVSLLVQNTGAPALWSLSVGPLSVGPSLTVENWEAKGSSFGDG